MALRAKFKVDAVTKRQGWDKQKGPVCEALLTPVLGDSEENKKFFYATPAGKIELQIINDTAGEYLVPGEEYYVDFTKAE